jgi:putative transposase
MCGACGAINAALRLSEREWTCGCGVRHDRDQNAAQNIRREGLRLLAEGYPESQNAS